MLEFGAFRLTSLPASLLLPFRRMRVPCMSRLRRDVREAHAGRRIGNADEVLAPRALNLAPGKLRFAFQGLIAMGAIEFEFIRFHSL